MDSINHVELVSPILSASHSYLHTLVLTFPAQTVAASQVQPVLLALLRSIFFHRTLEPVEPQSYEVFDVQVPCISAPDLEKELAGKVEEFVKDFVEDGRGATAGDVSYVFCFTQNGAYATDCSCLPPETA
jgi:hypothetical protein